jgi:glycosyltransferase involved in cell wall biosynthesis
MTAPEPRRIALVAYNTLDEAEAKGVLYRHDELTVHTYFNPGERFEHVLVVVPFGRRNQRIQLSASVTYLEREFRRGRTQLGTALRIAREIYPAARRIYQEVQRFGSQVIQANGPHLPAAVILASKQLRDMPSVCFLEAYWETLLHQQTKPPRFVRRLLPIWYRIVYRAFNRYCGTPSLAPDFYIRRGMRSERIAPWTQHFDLRLLDRVSAEEAPEVVKAAPRPRIAVLGRLHPEKHALDALSAFIHVANGRAGTLVFIGDGPERSQIISVAERAGIDNRVIVTGSLSNRLAIAAVRACDLSLAPMQGTALVEIMAAGLGIVAYDHETHRALVRHRENGLLVTHRDTAGMANALAELIDNHEFALILGRCARLLIEEKYSNEAVRATLSAAFEQAWQTAARRP